MTILRRLAAASALVVAALSSPSAIVTAAPTSYTSTAAGQAQQSDPGSEPRIPIVGPPRSPTNPTRNPGIPPVGTPLAPPIAIGGDPGVGNSTGGTTRAALDTTTDPGTAPSPAPTPGTGPNCDPVPTGDGGVIDPCDTSGTTANQSVALAAKKDLDALLKTSCANIPSGTQTGPLEGVLKDLSQPHLTIADRSYNLAVWIYSMGMTFSIAWFLIKVLPSLDHPTDAFRTAAFKTLSFCVFMLLIQFAAGKGFFANNTDAQGRPGATAAQTLTAFSTGAANYIGQDPKNPVGHISSAGDAYAVFACLGEKITIIPPLAVAAYSAQNNKASAWWNAADLISSTMAVIPVTILSIIAGIICCIVGVILAVNMFFLQWSALIIASASIFVLGLSSMEWTLPYANGYWRFVWSTMIGQFAVVLSTLIIARLVETCEQTQVAAMAADGTKFGIVPLGDILSIIFVLAFAAAIAIGTPAIAAAIASGEGSGLTPGKMALPLMALGGAGFFAASSLIKGLGALKGLVDNAKSGGGSNAISEGKEKADAARNEIAGEQADTMPTGNARHAAPERTGSATGDAVATSSRNRTHAANAGQAGGAPDPEHAAGTFEVESSEMDEEAFELDETLADASLSARGEVGSASAAAQNARSRDTAAAGSSTDADALRTGSERTQSGAGSDQAARAGKSRSAARPARGAADATGAAEAIAGQGDALAARLNAVVAKSEGELNARAIYQKLAAPSASAHASDAATSTTSQDSTSTSRSASEVTTQTEATGAAATNHPGAAGEEGAPSTRSAPAAAKRSDTTATNRSDTTSGRTDATATDRVGATPDAAQKTTGRVDEAKARASGAQRAPGTPGPLETAAAAQQTASPPDAATARRVASAVSNTSSNRFTGATASAYSAVAGGNVEQAMTEIAGAASTHAREIESASALLASASSDPKTMTVGNSAMRSRATASRAISKAAQSVSQMQSMATTPEQQHAVSQAATSVVSAATNLATSGPSAQTYTALGAASDSVAQAVVSIGPAAAPVAAAAVDNLALACSAMSTIAQDSAPSLTPAGPPTPGRRFTTIRRAGTTGGGAESGRAFSSADPGPGAPSAAPAAQPSPAAARQQPLPAALRSLESSSFTPDESESFRLPGAAAPAPAGGDMAAELRRQDLRQRREILRSRVTGVAQRVLDVVAHDQHISGVGPDMRHLGNTKH
jgi:hypothetical protein